jgi:hypothetical protein
VAEFWRKNPKKKPRKSVEPKASKRGRKSLAAEEESDTGSAARKRGRKPIADVESEEEDEITGRNRKTRKGEKTGKQRKAEDNLLLIDMGKYMDKDSWEDLVDTVDTVEKGNEGLQVFFTLYVARKPFSFPRLTGFSKEKWRTSSRKQRSLSEPFPTKSKSSVNCKRVVADNPPNSTASYLLRK